MLQVLQLHMSLLLGTAGLLDLALTGHGPANALYPLWRHLACPSNAEVVPALWDWASQPARGASFKRLLKLLCRGLFDRQRYRLNGVLARGGASVVGAHSLALPAVQLAQGASAVRTA